MDAQDFKTISTTVTNIAKLEKIYDLILVPMFKAVAEQKRDIIRITDNPYLKHLNSYSGEHIEHILGERITLQRLIETEMKPFLIEKGFQVHIWSPSYSVEVSW